VLLDVPSPGTRLLGRSNEVAAIVDQLRVSDRRFVTITGTGGAGKTRLAIDVAHELGPQLRDGAVFVDLAGVSDPGKVATTVVTSLDVGDSGADDPMLVLRRALSHRERLLVLDNFEQVLGAAPIASELIATCPRLRVLVTSRARLNVRPERVFELAALPLPPDPPAIDVERAAEFACVQLFCERAEAIRPDFRLDDDNLAPIVAVCRAVDGLPLAIELAAARTGHLPPAVLSERLTRSTSSLALDTLGRGAQDLPDRQRTMRATVEWSYDLLEEHEQRLVRRMAVFAADCSLDSIEAVCADQEPYPADSQLEGPTLLDALATLVDLHLVEPDDRTPADARFGMLVTIREFGREQLVAAGELDQLRARHARHYAELVDEASAQFPGPAEREWLQRLDTERIEIRAMLEHVAGTGDVAAGLRAATGAGPLWYYGGHVAEGRQWLERFVAETDEDVVTPEDRAAAEMWLAQLVLESSDSAQPAVGATAWGKLCEAVEVAGSAGDTQLELQARSFLSTLQADGSVPGEALAAAEAGLARAGELDEPWWRAEFTRHLAQLTYASGDRERAAGLAVDALAVAEGVGDERNALASLIVLAYAAPDTAHAEIAPDLADLAPRVRDRGARRQLGWLYPGAGSKAMCRGDLEEGARWYLAGLELARDTGNLQPAQFCIAGASVLAAVRGQPAAAVRLFGALAPMRSALESLVAAERLKVWDDLIDGIRGRTDAAAFDAWQRAGAALTFDEAIHEAIEVCRPGPDDVAQPDSAPSRPSPRADGAPTLDLTEREKDVLRLIAAGGTNKGVAADLGISAKTVMHHSVSIYRKLGVRGRAEATAQALRQGIIAVPDPL
jgi:predicted ATPase/DNA-binding CsgD family transcriptional regulator